MKLLLSLFLLLATLTSTTQAGDSNSPYIEITVSGLEQVSPPLNRLADAIENLSKSDGISSAEQQKIIAVVDELKSLTQGLDNSIDKAKQQASLVQQEISDSLTRLITLVTVGLLLCLIGIGVAFFILFKMQIAPLVNTTSSSLDKLSEAMNGLTSATKIISNNNQQNN